MNLSVFILLLFSSSSAFAADLAIVNVKRNIQLSEADPVYRDYYINAGEDSGLKKNMVVTVERKTAPKDAQGANSFGDIKIPIAQIKIIAVYKSLTIAREFKLISRKDQPVVDQVGIQVGDLVTLKDSFIDRLPSQADEPKQ